jgi:phosphatidylglycerophosphate synthase
VNPKLWPNILTGSRIVLMPPVVAVAVLGSQRWFVILLAIALATDVLDGYLARRLNAFSDFGRKLDSVADYLIMIAGLGGIALLWPEIVRRELPWIAVGLAAFVSVIVYGFVRLGRAPCYHTWAVKAGAAGCALSVIPLLAEWSAVPFHVMIVLQVCAALEEMVIALLLPAHVGEMPTLWHALRQRRERNAVLTMASGHVHGTGQLRH